MWRLYCHLSGVEPDPTFTYKKTDKCTVVDVYISDFYVWLLNDSEDLTLQIT